MKVEPAVSARSTLEGAKFEASRLVPRGVYHEKSHLAAETPFSIVPTLPDSEVRSVTPPGESISRGNAGMLVFEGLSFMV